MHWAPEHSPVDAQDCEGNTAPMLAAREGDAAIMRTLLDHGASVGMCNARGKTALHRARNGAVVALLLDAGAGIDQRDRFGYTPLTLLAQSGHADACRSLTERGAALDHRTPSGRTALLHALAGCHHDAFLALLDVGADRTLRSRNGIGLERLLDGKAAALRPAYDAWRARHAMQRALAAVLPLRSRLVPA